jgi:hypothetical protein
MDGDRLRDVNAEKVAAMFEATSNLNNWSGSSKVTPSVTTEEVSAKTMRFRILPGSGTLRQIYIRQRKIY